MPSIEFPEPIPMEKLGPQLGIQPDDRLVTQLVVKAGVVPVADVDQPVLILTGRDSQGRVLPQWLYAGDDHDMRRTVKLVKDMADLAMRTAAGQRRRGGR